MLGNLQGKVALITGASSGIGAATASALLSAGVRVAAVARRGERLRELGRKMGANDKQLLVLEADICGADAAQQLIDQTLAWGGKLDILINNAGLSRGAQHEFSKVGDLQLMLQTNLFALMNLVRVAIPSLKTASGHVVNISSTAALALSPGSAAYAGTKAAVAAFSEVIRKELCASGVRVTSILPGLVRTEFFDGFGEEKRKALQEMVEAVDGLRSEDLADTILFALSRPPHVSLNEIVIRPTKQLP